MGSAVLLTLRTPIHIMHCHKEILYVVFQRVVSVLTVSTDLLQMVKIFTINSPPENICFCLYVVVDFCNHIVVCP
jgi:hypothetical protein